MCEGQGDWIWRAAAAPEFSGCRGTARASEFRLGTYKKLCVPSLFLIEASYTVSTNGSIHGRINSFMWENGSPQLLKTLEKSFVKPRWIWAIVVQKTIFWPNMGCALQRAGCRSHIYTEAGSSCGAMTQHYPTTSTAAAVWACRPSFPVSAMLLIYTYSLLPAGALSKTLLFVLWLLWTWDKERCGSSRWLSNVQSCSDNCTADVSKRSHWQ